MDLSDNGKRPFVTNIEEATQHNDKFRVTTWTGEHLQVTLMSIQPNGEIGLEVHRGIDQFIRVESGTGRVLMGPDEKTVEFTSDVEADMAILVPAGTWHNIVNTSATTPLKLYSVYGPPDHLPGTVHQTKEDALADENEH